MAINTSVQYGGGLLPRYNDDPRLHCLLTLSDFLIIYFYPTL